jgi:hypothetical protein
MSNGESTDGTGLSELQEQSKSRVLKVPSAEGQHWIRYVGDEDEFRAVYEGPHGPENSEKTIDNRNIRELLKSANGCEIEEIDNSPFTEIEVVL